MRYRYHIIRVLDIVSPVLLAEMYGVCKLQPGIHIYDKIT